MSETNHSPNLSQTPRPSRIRDIVGRAWHGVSGPLLISAALTLAFYPGILMSDSVARWQTAFHLCGRTPWGETSRWFPPFMAVAMSQFCKGGANIWAFTFVQCACFYISLMLLVRVLRPDMSFRMLLYVGAMPTVLLNAVFVTPDTWTATGLMAIVAALFNLEQTEGSKRLFWYGILISAAFVAFAVRANTVVIAPTLIALVATSEAPMRSRKCIAALLLTAFVMSALANHDDRFHGDASMGIAGAWAWEYASTLKVLHDEGREIPAKLKIEDLGMNTEKAITDQDWTRVDTLLWDGDSAMMVRWLRERFDEFRSRYFLLIRSEPSAWLSARAHLAVCLLGLCPEFHEATPWYIGKDGIEQFGISNWGLVFFNEEGTGERFIRWHRRLAEIFPSAFRPLPWIFLATMAVFMRKKALTANRREVFTFALGLNYFLGFMLCSPSASFRYFFPSYLLFLIVTASAAHDLLVHFLKPANLIAYFDAGRNALRKSLKDSLEAS